MGSRDLFKSSLWRLESGGSGDIPDCEGRFLCWYKGGDTACELQRFGLDMQASTFVVKYGLWGRGRAGGSAMLQSKMIVCATQPRDSLEASRRSSCWKMS